MKKTFTAPAIHCHHCANTIKVELGDLVGVTNVDVDVDAKQVAVTYEQPATENSIKELLAEIGYPAAC